MKLISNDFVDQEILDEQYTCDGDNLSPHLAWEDYPNKTRSFALSCVDPDAPGGDFVHWLMYNIPVSTNKINHGEPIIEEASDIENDFSQTGYNGPCPPSGMHRYVFKIYAIDVPKLEYINRDNFFEKIKQHTLDSAEIIVKYGV